MIGWLNNNEGIGTWVGAVFTGLAAFVAATSYSVTVLRARRNQARLVVLAVDDVAVAKLGPGQISTHALDFQGALRNNSSEAITQVTGQSLDDEAMQRGWGLDRRHLAAGAEVRLGYASIRGTGPVEVFVEFRDASGRGWRRWLDGRLERVRDPLPLDDDILVPGEDISRRVEQRRRQLVRGRRRRLR